MPNVPFYGGQRVHDAQPPASFCRSASEMKHFDPERAVAAWVHLSQHVAPCRVHTLEAEEARDGGLLESN